MRLRTTAAVLAGALALVLPAAGPSLADTGDRDLGSLYYEYLDESGSERSGRIRPADNGTCYLLTGTSRDEPAVEVRNATRSVALLFGNRGCYGSPEKVLRPGARADGLEAVSVLFQAADDEDGRGDWGDGGGQGGDGQTGDGRGDEDQGRGDQARDDQAGSDQGRGDWQGPEDGEEEEEEDFFSLVLRAIG